MARQLPAEGKPWVASRCREPPLTTPPRPRLDTPPAEDTTRSGSRAEAVAPRQRRERASEERQPPGRLRQQVGSIELVQRGPEAAEPGVLRQASRSPIPHRPRVAPPFGPDLDLQRLVEQRPGTGPQRVFERR